MHLLIQEMENKIMTKTEINDFLLRSKNAKDITRQIASGSLRLCNFFQELMNEIGVSSILGGKYELKEVSINDYNGNSQFMKVNDDSILLNTGIER